MSCVTCERSKLILLLQRWIRVKGNGVWKRRSAVLMVDAMYSQVKTVRETTALGKGL